MSHKQFHGVTSLGLVGVATIIAAIAIFRASWALGIIYLAICAVASGAIIYAYCAKCSCKAHCAHVLPGQAAMAIKRPPGPYTVTELIVMALSLALIVGLPQFWLWPHTAWFVVYWVLAVIAVAQIRLFICKTCGNVYCPLGPGQEE